MATAVETKRAPRSARRGRPVRRLSIELRPEEEGLLQGLRLTAARRGVTVREVVLSALRETTAAATPPGA